MHLLKLILTLSLILFGTSCARLATNADHFQSISSDDGSLRLPENPDVIPVTKICSKLDLSRIAWPTELGGGEWPTYFALALNISGSFEGTEGWKNITGNFDGQGMSLGLMQQNFGQGSLQPLLIKMFKQDNAQLTRFFSTPDYLSMKVMLEDWQNSAISVPSVKSIHDLNNLFPDVQSLNDLDINPHQIAQPRSATENNLSVQWAKNNILSGTYIVPKWKSAFQSLAVTPSYRTLQVEASTAMFLKAKKYKDTFKFTQLRSLLMLYDVVVQNGGFTSTHLNLYNTWLVKNPNADEQAKALALLDARLTTVNPTYTEDVRARKTSIILGLQTVHGMQRNYPKEYCFNMLAPI